jgi:hypothetical protein
VTARMRLKRFCIARARWVGEAIPAIVRPSQCSKWSFPKHSRKVRGC